MSRIPQPRSMPIRSLIFDIQFKVCTHDNGVHLTDRVGSTRFEPLVEGRTFATRIQLAARRDLYAIILRKLLNPG